MSFSSFLGKVGNALTGGLGGALITGVSSLVGSAMNNSASERISKETNEFNAQQAELNRQYQTQMWNLTNEYNSPEQQMARLKAAGLNPNLVYGGNTVANSASSMPSGSLVTASPYDYNNGIGSAVSQAIQTYLAISQGKSQLESAKLQNENQEMQNKILFASLPAKLREEYLRHDFLNQFGLALNDIKFKDRVSESNILQLRESLQRMQNEDYTVTRNHLIKQIQNRTKLSDKELQLADERIKSAIMDNDLKRFNEELRTKFGILPGDPWYVRFALDNVDRLVTGSEGLQSFGGRVIDKVLDFLFNLFDF